MPCPRHVFHRHCQQGSLAHVPLTLSLLPPYYEDPVRTLGSPGNLGSQVLGIWTWMSSEGPLFSLPWLVIIPHSPPAHFELHPSLTTHACVEHVCDACSGRFRSLTLMRAAACQLQVVSGTTDRSASSDKPSQVPWLSRKPLRLGRDAPHLSVTRSAWPAFPLPPATSAIPLLAHGLSLPFPPRHALPPFPRDVGFS